MVFIRAARAGKYGHMIKKIITLFIANPLHGGRQTGFSESIARILLSFFRNASIYNGYRTVQVLRRFIGNLKPFTLYAFYVEAVTLNKKGARSGLQFLHTREMGMYSVDL